MKKNELSDPLYLAKALINCPSETPNDAGAIALLKLALEELGFNCHLFSFGKAGEKGREALIKNIYAKI